MAGKSGDQAGCDGARRSVPECGTDQTAVDSRFAGCPDSLAVLGAGKCSVRKTKIAKCAGCWAKLRPRHSAA